MASLENADVILISDARIDAHREVIAVDSFARTLRGITNKTWKGLVSPRHPKHRIGGDLIMFTNLIKKKKKKNGLKIQIFEIFFTFK